MPVDTVTSVPKVGAGTETHFEYESGKFKQVPEVVDAGQWGAEAAAVDATTESDTIERVVADMLVGSEVQMTLHDVPGNADQKQFLDKVRKLEVVGMKRIYATGTTFTCKVQWLGSYVPPAPPKGETVKVSIKGKITEVFEWGVVDTTPAAES